MKQVVNIAFPARISDLSAFFVESAGGEEEEVRPMSLRGLWSLQHALPKKKQTHAHTQQQTHGEMMRDVYVCFVSLYLWMFLHMHMVSDSD